MKARVDASVDGIVTKPFGLSAVDWLAVLLLVIVVAAYLPSSTSPFDVPRVGAMLVIVGPGSVLLVRSARHGDPASRLAIAFLGWAAVAALASDAPRLSLLGALARPTSWLVYVGSFAAWAIGRQVSSRGRAVLPVVTGIAIAVSGLVGLAQLLTDPTHPFLTLEQGRPVALVGNPIYFGMLCAGVCAMVGWHQSRRPTTLVGLWMAPLAFLVGLSGSRIALLAALTSAVAVVAVGRSRSSTLAAIGVLVGLTASALTHHAIGSEEGAVQRLGSSGMHDRWMLWRISLRAWLDAPILGAGPGRSRIATQSHYTPAWVQRFPDDQSGAWLDVHNVGLELLVVTGVIGLFLVLAFVAVQLGDARGPLAWGCSAIAVGWLFEPATVHTAPVAMLLLGAASTNLSVGSAPSYRLRSTLVGATVVGVALCASYVWSDARLYGRLTNARPDQQTFSIAEPWLIGDPSAASAMFGRFDRVEGPNDPMAADALFWADRVVEAEPEFPYWRAKRALLFVRLERFDEARAAAERSLVNEPNHVMSWQILEIVGLRTGDEQLERRAKGRLCALGIQC